MSRLLPILLLLVACEPPELEVDCASASPADLSGSVTEGATDTAVDSVLTVAGGVEHARGLAVRRVSVGGLDATSEGFNFERFSAELTWSTLSDLAVDGVAGVDVIAEDACGQLTTVASFDVPVSPVERGEVTRLDLDLDLGSDIDWLPADGTTQALLHLSANPEARGTAVDLDATVGTVRGADGLRLAGDGSDDATASALFVSDTPGTVVLTATAGGELASRPLVVAGPPSLLPAFVDVSPGARTALVARSEGEVEACRAVADAGIAVTSGGVDLTRAEAALDENGDGHPDIRVQADADAASGATAVITCRDPFGQAGTAEVTVP